MCIVYCCKFTHHISRMFSVAKWKIFLNCLFSRGKKVFEDLLFFKLHLHKLTVTKITLNNLHLYLTEFVCNFI